MVARLSAHVPKRRQPKGYPVNLEQPLGSFSIRPIVPEDMTRLRAEFDVADAETLRLRFFVPRPHLSEADFVHLATVDYSTRLAITAWDGRRPIAIARYEPVGNGAAEVAFAVRPEYRNRGIGRALVDILAGEAAAHGYERFEAVYLEENAPAARSLANAGFVIESTDDGIVTASRSLQGLSAHKPA